MDSVIGPTQSLTWRSRILDHLGAALQPWLSNGNGSQPAHRPDAPNFHLVKRAERLVAPCDGHELPPVPALARRLHVSERTLYRAFDVWAGMGPHEYFLTHRLHAFRRRLLTTQKSRGLITDAAVASGFTHFSRLAERYRKHFGELPRETVKRRGGAAAGRF